MIPQAISMIFVPLFALVPTVLAAHVILGPIGWTIGSWVSDIVNAGLTSTFIGYLAPSLALCTHH